MAYVPRRGDQLENEVWQSPDRQEWVSVITIVIMYTRAAVTVILPECIAESFSCLWDQDRISVFTERGEEISQRLQTRRRELTYIELISLYNLWRGIVHVVMSLVVLVPLKALQVIARQINDASISVVYSAQIARNKWNDINQLINYKLFQLSEHFLCHITVI